MEYQNFKIPPTFHLEVAQTRGFALTDYDKTRVNMLWQEEMVERASKLFNGLIFNFVSFEGDKMVGEFIDYKFYLAQLRDPGLEPLLKIELISVSGLTVSGDKVLLGRRSNQVTQDAGKWEAVPSGGIDHNAQRGNTIDLKEQFGRELWEETGISVTEIKRILPFLIVRDPYTHIYEICAEIDVNYTVVREERQPSEEYSELVWVPKSEMKTFLKKHGNEFVPFSLYLIQTAKFIR